MATNPHQLVFESRTHELELVQREVLADILQSLEQSDYAGGFAGLSDRLAESYVKAVPLVQYEDLRPWVERILAGQSGVLTADRTIAMFKTSGSTSSPKLVPVTPSLMRQKVAAFAIFWGLIYRDYPDVATGTLVSNFIDSGSSERSECGLEIYSESTFWSRRGRSINSLERWPLPAELRLVKDLNARLFAVARLLMQRELHCIMCLNPSTLLQFCRIIERYSAELANGLQQGTWGVDDPELLQALDVQGKAPLHSYLVVDEHAAKRLDNAVAGNETPKLISLWPMLKLVVCWQSEIVQPYFTQLAPYISAIPVRDYISQSSECIMAIPIEDGSSGGALAYTSHFYEFIAEKNVELKQPDTVFPWQVQKGLRYELVVTTGGGLYRYRTGDCFKIKRSWNGVPVIEFLYRFGKTSSITGEKLTELQVLDAAKRACEVVGYHPSEYLCFPCSGEVPHYSVMVDSNKLPSGAAATDAIDLVWFMAFEKALKTANTEYNDKCESGRLGPMQLYRVGKNALAGARAQQKAASVSDEQVKSEVLSNKLDRHQNVESAVRVG